jgi:hypothetical protein
MGGLAPCTLHLSWVSQGLSFLTCHVSDYHLYELMGRMMGLKPAPTS